MMSPCSDSPRDIPAKEVTHAKVQSILQPSQFGNEEIQILLEGSLACVDGSQIIQL